MYLITTFKILYKEYQPVYRLSDFSHSLKQHYITLTATCGFENKTKRCTFICRTKQQFLQNQVIFYRESVLCFSPWSPVTAQPKLCDLQRLLKATQRLSADWSRSSSSSRSLLGTVLLHQRLQTDGAIVGHQRENQTISHKIWLGFTEIAVLCNVLTCIVQFHFHNTGPKNSISVRP